MTELDSNVTAFEKELGLPEGFYSGLFREDDWSFVIKLHALFESAVTFALTKHLGNDALEEVIANLEMGNKRSGKVAFGKALGIFSLEERRFLNSLSELRNLLVHRVQNVSFDLKAHVAAFTPQRRDNFTIAFGYGIGDPVNVREGVIVQRSQFVAQNPKLAIWLTGWPCLAAIYLEKEVARFDRMRAQQAVDTIELMTEVRKATEKASDSTSSG